MKARMALLTAGLACLVVGSLVVWGAIADAATSAYSTSFATDPTSGLPGPVDSVHALGEIDVAEEWVGSTCHASAVLDNDSIWVGTDLIVGTGAASAEALDVERVKGSGIPVDIGDFLVAEVPVPVMVRLGTGETGSGTFPLPDGQAATSLAGEATVTCESTPPVDPPPTPETPECVDPEPCEPPPSTPPPAAPITGTPKVTG